MLFRSPRLDAHYIPRLQLGDTIMACSDGLWHYFTVDEIGSVLNALPPRDASEFLVEKARERAMGGGPFAYLDITEKYDELVANPNITKTKIKARDLETEISKLQQESGYPYVVNIDTANRSNPIDGKIVMSNLCEIESFMNPA